MKKLICFVAFISLVSCHESPDPELAAKRAKNAITVEEYRERLLECKAEGKKASSMAVYERCAREADIKYGLDQSVDGG